MQKAIEEFIIDVKRQKSWGWLIAVALFLAAVGSGLFLLSLLVERNTGAEFNLGYILGIIIGGVGTSVAFILDLGRKRNFWRVLARPGQSWISRGIILIVVFVVFGVLYVVPEWLTWLPWSKQSGIGQAFLILGALGAFGTMLYSGFVLAYSSAIRFWNAGLLPILCVVYALLSGIGATILLNLALRGSASDFGFLTVLEMSLIIFTLIILFAYLLTMLSSTASGKRAAQLVLKSRFAGTFWGGVIAAGLIIPLAITLFVYFALPAAVVATGLLLIVAGILELAGALLFRYTLLRAGVYPAQI